MRRIRHALMNLSDLVLELLIWIRAENRARRRRVVALGVEEHFAARRKADPTLVVTARDKFDLFVERLDDPGLRYDEAARLAEETVASIGLGSSATRPS